MHYKHIFGPVPSRRLGVSLGVDTVLHKICSMDCIYCECGKTTRLTMERMEYVPLIEIKEELNHFFQHNSDPDYITFSGSGEPTLNTNIGELIDYIRSVRPDTSIAVLTNSSLIDCHDVKAALLKADVVLPSLDAVTEDAFMRINRAHPKLKAKNIAKGIEDFAKEFTGKIWLEVLILPEINDNVSDIIALKEVVHRIRPDRLQLNTLDRPGTIFEIKPASDEALEWVASILDYPDTEIISKNKGNKYNPFRGNYPETAILETIRRRPCTKTDLLKIFGTEEKILNKYLRTLTDESKIVAKPGERGLFYHIQNPPPNFTKS
jgi:wyosine [tRNA(Phe)-imidazoG37] synthetase (radical SAM superfamily)